MCLRLPFSFTALSEIHEYVREGGGIISTLRLKPLCICLEYLSSFFPVAPFTAKWIQLGKPLIVHLIRSSPFLLPTMGERLPSFHFTKLVQKLYQHRLLVIWEGTVVLQPPMLNTALILSRWRGVFVKCLVARRIPNDVLSRILSSERNKCALL